MKKQQLDYPFFYLKCPRKYKKTNNFDIFFDTSQICTSPPFQSFGKILNLTMRPMSKFVYAKFGVSNLFFFKSYRRETLRGGGRADPW